ncbi:hypothetical protein AMS68_003598 [Peltaster fructicola]|uniref:Uncharacterized protein n=1 Tax=Peltaster fructicola TaxID=286661 RepID=A0A6H0XTS9_9PEZI|nr:hypothetical protein AMS68_003598 [Peltaster fructicola]
MSMRMDISGRNKLQVPGFNDIPLTLDLPGGERFAHGLNDTYAQTPGVTARELAMTAIMNVITDQLGWSEAILQNDEQAIAAWKVQAFETEVLISEKAWDWCLAELRDKAVEHRDKHFIRVLDTGSCVCKTDTLIDESVGMALQGELQSLSVELTPTNQEQLSIDPFLYPLVYGETRVLRQGTVSSSETCLMLDDMLISTDKTVPAGEQPVFDIIESEVLDELRILNAGLRRKGSRSWYRDHRLRPEDYWWSTRYQCLPCDIEFDGSGTQLRITSYVNNLHPQKRRAYRALEKVMSASVRLWNECLVRARPEKAHDNPANLDTGSLRQMGRYPLRILTFGAHWQNVLPTWARSVLRSHKVRYDAYQEAKTAVLQAPEPVRPSLGTKVGVEYNVMRYYTYLEGVPPPVEPTEQDWRHAEEYLGRQLSREDYRFGEGLLQEARRRAFWAHPEPGTAFTYEDWKVSRNVDRAVVNPILQRLEHDRLRAMNKLDCGSAGMLFEPPTHDRYEIRLEESFRDFGLQMIVKTGSIHPISDHKSSTGWRVDGHMNEHIVGVACYMYDSSNVDCQISFAQEVHIPWDAYRYQGDARFRCVKDDLTSYQYNGLDGLDDFGALAAILGFEKEDILAWMDEGDDEIPVQQTGSIRMSQGRLIAFPSILEYNLEASLVNAKLGSGHADYVLIYLVDPNYRVCSTSNVPPQQQDWWSAAIADILWKKGLPPELVDHILSYYEFPMSRERAEEHRRAMSQEDAWLEIARHVGMSTFAFK